MQITFIPASDASLLVVVGDEISEGATDNVIGLFQAVRAARAPFVVDLHPAYTSVLVEFDPATADHARVQRLVERVARSSATRAPGRMIEIAVRYGGPDLDDVAALTRLTRAEVLERHAAGRYVVAFLGFVPGFAYLLGLDDALAVPRLDVPRPRVPAGTVAIGGRQAAIYPTEGPGGWRWIGHTDASLAPGWAEPGDVVRFVAAP